MRNALNSQPGIFVAEIIQFLAVMGQVALFGGALEPHDSVWKAVVCLLLLLPWLVVFSITFLKQPLLSASAFNRCLVFALVSYAATTIVAELLIYWKLVPPESPRFARGAAQFLMHVGWFSMIPFVALYLTNRAIIRNSDA
jgi:hypothetical protein